MSADRRDLGFALVRAAVGKRRTRETLKAWIYQTASRWISGAVESLLHAVELLLDRIISTFGKGTFCASSSAAPASGLSVIVVLDTSTGDFVPCLASVAEALKRIQEPSEVRVLACGPEESLASALRPTDAFGWDFENVPGPISEALRKAVEKSRFGWIYILTDRVILDPLALEEILHWRTPRVFSVASHAQESCPARSGWTGYSIVNGLIEPGHGVPPSASVTMGTLYAEPNGALFNRTLLTRLWRRHAGYKSLEFESLEWGIRAWKLGFESLFCPSSKIRLENKSKTNPSDGADRDHDRLKFHVRNAFPESASLLGLWRKRRPGEHAAAARLTRLKNLLEYVACRVREISYPFRSVPFEYLCSKYYPRQLDRAPKPGIIFVSPYVVYPPSHGGAVRMHQLIRALSRFYDVHLISDEISGYCDESMQYFQDLASVHLVGGRIEDPVRQYERIVRMDSHAHKALRAEVNRLQQVYGVGFVEVQTVELARLIEEKRSGNARWLLTLHDVLLSDYGSAEADRCELKLIREYDSVITCSPEDAALLGDIRSHVVPNGIEVGNGPYVPSPQIPRILFVGPFRSPVNLSGIEIFLVNVYPALLNEMKDVELWIVGGRGCRQQTGKLSTFHQKGVRLLDYVADMRGLLDEVALTVNPMYDNRGSCLKVCESLAAHRVCVSTTQGARGFLNYNFPSLVLVDRIEDLHGPLLQLLQNPAYRRSLEYLAPEDLQKMSWDNSARALLEAYGRLGPVRSWDCRK